MERQEVGRHGGIGHQQQLGQTVLILMFGTCIGLVTWQATMPDLMTTVFDQ